MSSRQDDLTDSSIDGDLTITSTVGILLAYRASADEPQLRDEGAENLLQYTRKALNGQGFGELCYTETARVTGWTWQPPASAERKILATFTYQFEDSGWEAADVTP